MLHFAALPIGTLSEFSLVGEASLTRLKNRLSFTYLIR